MLAKFVLSHNYLSDTAMPGTVAICMILSNCQALNSMDDLPELPIHSRAQSKLCLGWKFNRILTNPIFLFPGYTLPHEPDKPGKHLCLPIDVFWGDF